MNLLSLAIKFKNWIRTAQKDVNIECCGKQQADENEDGKDSENEH